MFWVDLAGAALFACGVALFLPHPSRLLLPVPVWAGLDVLWVVLPESCFS